MRKNIFYIFVTLFIGLAFSSCKKSSEVDRTADKTIGNFELTDVWFDQPNYEMAKSFMSFNGTSSYVSVTPFDCRPFTYFKNANNEIEYSVSLVLTNAHQAGTEIDTKNIIAHGKIAASQLNSNCNEIEFYQDGSKFKIKINGQDPIEQY